MAGGWATPLLGYLATGELGSWEGGEGRRQVSSRGSVLVFETESSSMRRARSWHHRKNLKVKYWNVVMHSTGAHARPKNEGGAWV